MVAATAHEPISLDALLEAVCVDLQITDTQREKAETRYRSIGTWLESADSGLLFAVPLSVYSQGSLRIGTTVRPLAHSEFDLDIVVEAGIHPARVEPPTVLLNAIEARLRQNGRYAEKLERKNRCIRIVYADEFHLDVLPGCPDPTMNNGAIVVPDRRSSAWKASNPNGFAKWFEAQATSAYERRVIKAMAPLPANEASSVKATLKKVVQLLKRNRDLVFSGNEGLAPVSIVLTTLAGVHYDGSVSLIQGLQDCVNTILLSLPKRGRLKVYNPTNSKELLSERWEETPDSYDEFVRWLVRLSARLVDLQHARGLQEVVPILADLFGERPADAARKSLVESLERHRRLGGLSANPSSGALVTSVASGLAPVRRNTFFGA